MTIDHKKNLSRRVTAMAPSMTQAMVAEAKKLMAQGVDILSFGAGEPDFDTPENIKHAGIQAIRSGLTKYTEVSGTAALKQAVIRKFERDQSVTFKPDQVIVCCGAKHALFNLAVSLFDDGDEVLLPAPYWVSYPEQIRFAGARPVILETREENRFTLTMEDLERAVTDKTKAIILNSPNNPTGEILNQDILAEIADFAVQRGIYVISDECYEKLIYDSAEHVSIVSLGKEIRELTIVVNAVSKTYAMTGWRIGYAAGPAEIIRAMTKVQSQATSNPTSIAQQAAVEALDGPQDAVMAMRKEFERRRNHMVGLLNKVEGISCLRPEGSFYAFPNVSGVYGKKYKGSAIEDSLALADFLLDVARVAVVPGIGFGSDNHIRLSFPYSLDTISEGIRRMEDALGRLDPPPTPAA